jgi:hypothetical protein
VSVRGAQPEQHHPFREQFFDVVARRHASFLKDYAPLAGRDFRISARHVLTARRNRG